MRAVNRKRLWLTAGVTASLLLAGAWLVAAERGPFECDNGCGIDYPKPDEKTKDYMEQMKPLFNRWFGDMFWNKGDIYIICNPTHCAKYYITDDFGIYGTEGRIPREGGTSGMASGGGEAGGQGGYDPGWNSGGGGGITGGGTGTVHVGDPQTVQE